MPGSGPTPTGTVHLASLPLDDIEENATIVNASSVTQRWSPRKASPKISA